MNRRKAIQGTVAAVLATPAQKLVADYCEDKPESPDLAAVRKQLLTEIRHRIPDNGRLVNLADLHILARVLENWDADRRPDDAAALLNAFWGILGRYSEYIIFCPQAIHRDAVDFIEVRKAATAPLPPQEVAVIIPRELYKHVKEIVDFAKKHSGEKLLLAWDVADGGDDWAHLEELEPWKDAPAEA